MLHTKYQNLLKKQSYDPKPTIDGVVIKDLKTFNDDGGSFCEILKFNENFKSINFDWSIKQCSWSVVEPNVVKAFHIHMKQIDLWFVPATEKLLIGLLDTRENSSSFDSQMRFVMGSGKSQLLLIPNGVAHGYANLTHQKQSLFYFTSEMFDITDNDEYRLPWNILGDDFWKLKYE